MFGRTRTSLCPLSTRMIPTRTTSSGESTSSCPRSVPAALASCRLTFMSNFLRIQAPGVPLIRHFHSMSPSKMHDLLTNLANMLVPLSTQSFPAIGSLYQTGELTPSRDTVRSILRRSRTTSAPDIHPPPASPNLLRSHHHHHHTHHLHPHLHAHQRPGPSPLHESSVLPDSPSMWTMPAPQTSEPSIPDPKKTDFYVGPIVAWPFFGSGRGELPSRARPGVPLSPSAPAPPALPSPTSLHSSSSSNSSNALQFEPSPSPSPEFGDEEDPDEVDRGPFRTFESYVRACARREVAGVRREQDQAGAAHKPHLVPASEDGRGAKRVKRGLGALGSDGLGGLRGGAGNKKVRRRRRGGLGSLGSGGLGSLGSGEGGVPALSVSSSSSSSGISSPTDSDGCSCATSDCSCSPSSSSGSSPASTSSSEEDSDEDDFYRDYRSAQRSSLFVGLNFARIGAVRAEMERWVGWMTAQSQGQTHDRIDEEGEDSDSTTDAEDNFPLTASYAGVGTGGVGSGGFVALTPAPTPASIRAKKVATSPPRGVGVGGGGFVGVGPAPVATAAPSSSFTFSASPPRARGGVGPGGFVGVAPLPTPASTSSSTPARGVGVGGGGFLGVAAPLEAPAKSGSGFVGVGGGGWMSVGGGIPSPEDESPVSPVGGFGGGGFVGVGVGGGFLSVAAAQSPPRNTFLASSSSAPKPIGRGVGAGGFVSVAQEPTVKEGVMERRREKRKREVEKDELGDFVFDLHDLSLANIFVDPLDSSKIVSYFLCVF